MSLKLLLVEHKLKLSCFFGCGQSRKSHGNLFGLCFATKWVVYIIFMLCHPRLPRQVQWSLSRVTVVGVSVGFIALNFANVNMASV
jgi:hypothetical protein